MAHSHSGSSSTVSRSNWNLEMLFFLEGGKPENPEKNLLEEEPEPTTNSTYLPTQTRATVVGGECSHHCDIPASLLITPVIYPSISSKLSKKMTDKLPCLSTKPAKRAILQLAGDRKRSDVKV